MNEKELKKIFKEFKRRNKILKGKDPKDCKETLKESDKFLKEIA